MMYVQLAITSGFDKSTRITPVPVHDANLKGIVWVQVLSIFDIVVFNEDCKALKKTKLGDKPHPKKIPDKKK